MKKTLALIGYLSCLYLAAVNGTAVETLLAALCGIVWVHLPSRKVRVAFYVGKNYRRETPPVSPLLGKTLAFLYRRTGKDKQTLLFDAHRPLAKVADLPLGTRFTVPNHPGEVWVLLSTEGNGVVAPWVGNPFRKGVQRLGTLTRKPEDLSHLVVQVMD